MKLTGPQRVLLADIAQIARCVSETYPPAIALVKFGLAEWNDMRLSTVLRITEAGRQALGDRTGEGGEP